MAKARILIASGRRELRDQLYAALKDYELIGAGTAAMASIELIERSQPDAAIWDLAPAGEFAMDALEAIRVLKPGLPVIALDEPLAGDEAPRYLDLGSLKILTKPVSAGLLAAVLERLLATGPAEVPPPPREGSIDPEVMRHQLYNLVATQEIFESLPVAAMVVDKDRHILAINREARALTRTTNGAVGRATCRAVCRCRTEESRCPLKTALATWSPVYRWESAVCIPRGARKLIERISPFRDPNSGQERAVIVLGDATAHFRRLERVFAQARIDALTNVFTRAHFEERVARRSRGERRRRPDSFLMIDVDGLKEINDRHGHAAGDRLLRRLGQILLESTRHTDLVGRLGGDEFGIYCPGAGPAEARALAERIRRAAARDNARRPGEPALSLSIGSAGTHEPGVTDVRKTADERLYAEKKSVPSEKRP